MSARRVRVDDLLVSRGLAPDRPSALAMVVAGEVTLGNRRATSAGELVDCDTPVHVPRRPRFVSRGGEKLAGALAAFSFDPTGLHCIDLGASTGGFTDCLLKAGAADVTCVDVGYGDLAWSLRSDPRVTVVERTNVRTMDAGAVAAPFDLAVSDLSFIRIETVLPTVVSVLREGGHLITLVKPQFEVPRDLVGDGGVVSDPTAHIMAVEGVMRACAAAGLAPAGLAASPITGPAGNIEFLLMAQKGGVPCTLDAPGVVTRAHERFGTGASRGHAQSDGREGGVPDAPCGADLSGHGDGKS